MELLHGDITDAILASFYSTYDELDFGYHEALCAKALETDLMGRGLRVRREVGVPVLFRGRPIGLQRLDMIVEELVVVEVKAIEALHPAAIRQTRSYLRGTRLEVGLVLNFGPRAEFRRVILTNDRKARMPGLDDSGHGRRGRGTGTARTSGG